MRQPFLTIAFHLLKGSGGRGNRSNPFKAPPKPARGSVTPAKHAKGLRDFSLDRQRSRRLQPRPPEPHLSR